MMTKQVITPTLDALNARGKAVTEVAKKGRGRPKKNGVAHSVEDSNKAKAKPKAALVMSSRTSERLEAYEPPSAKTEPKILSPKESAEVKDLLLKALQILLFGKSHFE